ncbi:hypothetical protein B6V00_04045 [ANME-1 cluster archaeon ex4572_4]|nr:MAG: hypothetical protein B6V00_04045 [ANME-1 cluster archaeon ex4572_4]
MERIIGIAIFVLLVAGVGAASADTFVPGEVIVGFERATGVQAQESLIKSCGGAVTDRDTTLGWVLAKVEEGKEQEFIANISGERGVRYAERNGVVRALYVPNDPKWSEQWGLERINADDAWKVEKGSTSVKIAIVDTGVDYNHEDLNANYFSGGYDWVNDDSDPWDDSEGRYYGHGTHCAGIAAAEMDNSAGIAGVAQVGILAEKILNETGYGSYSDLASGIQHAAAQGAKIISLSVGGNSASPTLKNACKYAWDMGCLLVAAAGNDDTTEVCYPARYETVVAVGAINEVGVKSIYSNYGPDVELAAPGDDILSTIPNNTYTRKFGTSMATPFVAGVAGLVWSRSPELTNEEVRERLHRVSTDYDWVEYGLVDAARALSTAAGSDYARAGSLIVTIGKNATTQVSVGNAKNITGVSLNLEYDASKLSVQKIAANETTNQSSNGSCYCYSNTTSAGVARIVFLTAEPLNSTTSETPILDIEFKAVGGADTRSYLNLSSVEFANAGYLPFAPSKVFNGTVEVKSSLYGVNLTVEGTKCAWNFTEPNENATFLLALRNTGVVADNYTLEVESPEGAEVAALNSTEITNLAPEATAKVLLQVTSADEGTYTVNVTVTSECDLDIYDQVTTRTLVATRYNLQTSLLEGWNLFGVPLNVSVEVGGSGWSLPAVLASIEGKYDYLSYYNTSTGRTDFYDPLNTEFSTLKTLKPGAGYLVHLTEEAPVSLEFEGVKLRGLEVPLERGWNMFSVPYGVADKTLPAVLKSIEGNYDYIYYYNATTGEMDYYDPLNPELSTLKILEPGAGYLIHIINKVTYFPAIK